MRSPEVLDAPKRLWSDWSIDIGLVLREYALDVIVLTHIGIVMDIPFPKRFLQALPRRLCGSVLAKEDLAHVVIDSRNLESEVGEEL